MSLDEEKINEIYDEGFKEGYNKNDNVRKREYHAGYKQGYRDACDDRYWLGWYSGIMVGTIITMGGILLYSTSKKSRITLF
jgi:hypothetical protein